MTSPMDEMILRSALKNLEFERDAALKRAEAAEAERRDAERRENAAHLEREQSARLRYRAEVALLRWDTQAIGAALGLPIGADVPGRAVGAIKSLRERAEKAEAEAAKHSQDAMIAYKQREEARSEAARLKFVPYEGGGLSPVTYKEALAHTEQERDEARAEVAKLKASLADAHDGLSVALGLKGVKQKALEAAEAEVARLRGLLEKRPEPYTPRVGDVVLFDGERAESAEATPRVVTSVEPDGWWSCVHLNRRRDAVACGPFRISGRIGEARLHRSATPAERAAAGLAPAEAAVATEKPVAPAQPQVLPEHLAWMEADAAWACSSWSTDFDAPENKKRHDEAILAARALSAAVARRDGGQK